MKQKEFNLCKDFEDYFDSYEWKNFMWELEKNER